MQARGCLVIFGGLDARHRPLADLWQFCVATRAWTPLATPPSGGGLRTRAFSWPAARHQHSLTALVPPPLVPAPTTTFTATHHDAAAAAVRGNATASPALLLFGGVSLPARAGGSPLLDDGLWLLSLRRAAWVRVHTPAGARRPSARIGHVALASPASTLWLATGLTAAAAEDDAAWLFAAPSTLEAALSSCFGDGDSGGGSGGGDGSGGGSGGRRRVGCSARGSCDLAVGRCICEPPWTGDDCDELPLSPEEARRPASRRALILLLCFSGALLVGAVLGWVQRDRGLAAEDAQHERDLAREARRDGAGRAGQRR